MFGRDEQVSGQGDGHARCVAKVGSAGFPSRAESAVGRQRTERRVERNRRANEEALLHRYAEHLH